MVAVRVLPSELRAPSAMMNDPTLMDFAPPLCPKPLLYFVELVRTMVVTLLYSFDGLGP